MPISIAFSSRFSSFTILSAVLAAAHARGFPPYVDPCSPGFMHIIISSSAKTADTGKTPPDNAFPRIRTSGLASS